MFHVPDFNDQVISNLLGKLRLVPSGKLVIEIHQQERFEIEFINFYWIISEILTTFQIAFAVK